MAALVVGLMPLEWTWSTVAGVRAPAVAFVAAVLLAALRWERAVQTDAPAQPRRLLILALLVGLALDHHRTIALMLPFLAAFVLLVRWRTLLDLPLLAKALALAVLPLALYLILPLRARFGVTWDQYNTGTWHGFWNLVLGSPDTSAHLDLSPPAALARLPLLLQALPSAVPAPALALAFIGSLWLVARRPALTLLLLGYTAVLGLLALEWDIGSTLNLVYFLPAAVPLAVLTGAGLGAIDAAMRKVPLGSSLPWALALLVAALGLTAGRSHFQAPSEVLGDFRLNLFQGHQGRRLADAFAALPADSTVVADWDQATVLWYAQYVDGTNRSVRISFPTSTLPTVLQRSEGPVYLATAAARPATSNLSMLGPFVQVRSRTNTVLPAGLVTVRCAYDGQIELAGIAPLRQPQYGVLPVTLYWRALRPPAADYAVSVRLMPTPNRVAVQRDEASPVLGLSPTSHWVAGQITADYYELDLSHLANGVYDLVVVVYQPLPHGYRNLPCGGTDRPVIGHVVLARGTISFSSVAAPTQP